MKRKIAIVTGSRAEYGLLKPLICELKKDKNAAVKLLVTGSHLSKEFGSTYKEIEKDGFTIDAKLKIPLHSDDPSHVSASLGQAVGQFSKTYHAIKPDLLVVLGDRYEILAATIPAYMARIPVAHIHGGEVTEGVLDEAFRHSITKMSQLHFTAAEAYRRRVIQLGEAPSSVFNVGAIGLDDVDRRLLLSKAQVQRQLNVNFKKRNLMVTYHPETLGSDAAQGCRALLEALSTLKDTLIIFTKSNQDAGGRLINRMIEDFARQHRATSKVFASLGRTRYLSTLQYVDAVVGNSSSGVIEAPSFKIGTVNIGDRQKGRVKAESIIDCPPTKNDIIKALDKLYSREFQTKLKRVTNPYGQGRAAVRIKKILMSHQFNGTAQKHFYDLPAGG